MKKFIFGAIFSVFALALVVVPANADPSEKPSLDWQKQVNVNQCKEDGKPVINVTQNVRNTIDSGEGGNYWAYLNLNRQIKVYEQEDGVYCAVVKYEGKFDGQEGQKSPGAGGTLTGKEDGTMQGGYRATITGDLLENPIWPMKGHVGPTDYACDVDLGPSSCSGAVNWIAQYFGNSYGFSYQWWGWIYHGGKYGTWVNSQDGNSGDIL